ncbi:MAG: AAA family ATPase [Myxococcota bacterium]
MSSLFAAPEPLAARMRPRTLDEFVGQDAVVGKGRLLRRAIEADQLSSVIFFGPPGTGKTTLARVIANSTRAEFTAINAVLGGVKDIREAVADAKARKDRDGRRTILFVDEVHRFNKSQQDALLPWVEDGTVILVGATTENPYFEVNPALVSRSRLFRLEPLGPDALREVLARALTDPTRGYGGRKVALAPDAASHLVDVANGDARTLLNALELAVDTTKPDADGVIRVDLAVAEESIQRRAVLYDREGDAHFDAISAFIKSVRGSDPDASLYWLARMLYAGEDPRYLLRRLLILASEDVGLADPHALSAVVACAQSFDRVGMPEGRYPLAQATLILATAPKSNSTMGLFDALAAVEGERTGDVPVALKDKSRDAKGMGHGAGYLYPHAYQDHWVAQQYLPTSLVGRVFWHPSDQGYEATVKDALARRREAQLAAIVEPTPEPWSTGPTDAATDRWLVRAQGAVAGRLEAIRELVLDAAGLLRHHVVLDVAARSGLLVWESMRRTPEGQVWARVDAEADADTIRSQASRLPELRRPVVVVGDLATDQRFDRILGRDALDDPRVAGWLTGSLTDDGLAVLVGAAPRHAQRLSALVDVDPATRRAEEAVYAELPDQAPAWDGLTVTVERVTVPGELAITRAMTERWFGGDRSLGARIAAAGGDAGALALAVRQLEGRTVPWTTTLTRVVARRRLA